ncbi:DUF6412 domain-containing protein [Micromonospora rifamycinica]|uniref:DUF6412 domain-containing protein n=1 Tax=Micromonospora rifamycinica TaxID=291594 RepID=UPI002E29EEBE|nr:DUF6412 domain-containing protein [Micromonospora rifamycinica]
MSGLRVVTGLWAYALVGLTLLADRPGDLLAGAAVVAALLLVALLAARPRPAGGSGGGRRQAVGSRARRRDVPRQVDPDAPGRPRPRAPGGSPPVGWSPVAG